MTTMTVATVGTAPSTRSRTVLVLNASFEPLRPVYLKRAVSLLVRGSAVVHQDDGTGRYLTNAGRDQLWPWPKILRLTRYVKVAYVKFRESRSSRRRPVGRRRAGRRGCDVEPCAVAAPGAA